MAGSKGLFSTRGFHVDNAVNRHWSTALCSIEGKEPTLTALTAGVDAKSSRVEHAQGGFIVRLFKKAFLRQ